MFNKPELVNEIAITFTGVRKMDNRGQGSGTTFEEASKRFMDVFDEPGSIVQPVGVKPIPTGHKIPEGTRTHEEYQGVPRLEQRLNGSFSGLGMPLSAFEPMVTGMARSAGGFPYKIYT